MELAPRRVCVPCETAWTTSVAGRQPCVEFLAEHKPMRNALSCLYKNSTSAICSARLEGTSTAPSLTLNETWRAWTASAAKPVPAMSATLSQFRALSVMQGAGELLASRHLPPLAIQEAVASKNPPPLAMQAVASKSLPLLAIPEAAASRNPPPVAMQAVLASTSPLERLALLATEGVLALLGSGTPSPTLAHLAMEEVRTSAILTYRPLPLQPTSLLFLVA